MTPPAVTPPAVTLLALLLACGGAEPAPGPTPPAATAPAATAPAAPPPDPLAGRSTREICEDNGLALIRWEFGTLQAGFQGLCCGPDGLQGDAVCEMDWPFNDVPPCSAYDALRNHVYARYGYDFTDPTWQGQFEGQPWYVQRKDFDPSWLSEVARKNVATLQQLKADKVACEG